MTWAAWVASAYNTAGFTVSSNKVYDANNQVVQKNGSDVADTDMVRYGDSYTLASASGYSVTVTYQGIYDADVYDGQDSTGTLLASLDSNGNETATVVCSSGYIYADGIGTLSITGSNGATSDNPSTVSANGATITIIQSGSGGGG